MEQMEKIKRDGHVHTPFCRHGSKDSFDQYVEMALRLGREEMTFTEHFPLPQGIADEKFILECSLIREEVPDYMKAVQEIKERYAGRIKIALGFEVDYIEGKEQEIREDLEKWGGSIEDAILSVHFVLYEGKYYAIDCLGDFESLLAKVRSMQAVYDLYFETVLKSVRADLGSFKPKRIGHPSLIRIFNKKYPFEYEDDGLFETLIKEIKERKMEIDFNSAGLRKPLCGESYPLDRLLKLARSEQIQLVPGSDAHEAEHMLMLERLASL